MNKDLQAERTRGWEGEQQNQNQKTPNQTRFCWWHTNIFPDLFLIVRKKRGGEKE